MSDRVSVLENDRPPVRRRAAAGPETATYLSRDDFEIFVREYFDRLSAVAARILRSPEDAADAVQDALLSAYTARHRFLGQSTVYTWLYRIVANACLMQVRMRRARKRRHQEATRSVDDCLFDIDDRTARTPIAAMERDETASVIRTHLQRLPEDFRNVLLLRDIQGLDTIETARRLRISSDAVKTRVCRARQALRLLIELNDASSRGDK